MGLDKRHSFWYNIAITNKISLALLAKALQNGKPVRRNQSLCDRQDRLAAGGGRKQTADRPRTRRRDHRQLRHAAAGDEGAGAAGIHPAHPRLRHLPDGAGSNSAGRFAAAAAAHLRAGFSPSSRMRLRRAAAGNPSESGRSPQLEKRIHAGAEPPANSSSGSTGNCPAPTR